MNTPWYHKTTIYQIYPRSFYDSNGDGIGDLQGIIQKLDYIHDLGFETIWISPFFVSPQTDVGYDIADYTDIAPEYGTMADALQLIEEVHKHGMRIVFDMVMNHTSIEHPWFKESKAARTNPKADWYIWRGKPTNWQSMTGGSGWHFAPERGEYFWSSFLPFQPDLNYRNPEVKQTMLDTVRFWLAKGVDGFRLDIFNVIYKDAEFRDNPFLLKAIPTEDDPSGFFQQAKYNLNRPESFEFARELRAVTEEFGQRMLLGEVSGNRELIRKYSGGETNNGLGLVFDFGMLSYRFSADYFRGLIAEMEAHYPAPFMPVYVFSNHDRHRSIRRVDGDQRKARLLAMLQLTVRGVPCMYYGEEIGMTDLPMPFDKAIDPIAHKYKNFPRFVLDLLDVFVNRDEARTPMQWDAAKNAGFSSAAQTWLPVHPNHTHINVTAASKSEDSLLRTIQAILALRRREQALREGSLELRNGLPADVLSFTRNLAGEQLTVLLNFGSQPREVDFSASECLFKLSPNDEIKKQAIRLDGLGGMIVK